MAMKKGELEEHRDKYDNLMLRARRAHQNGLFREAVQFALASWDYIDGMMQYERKYEKAEFESISAIDLVLKYAPVLLDSSTLDKLSVLLEEKRRIERDTSADMGAKLTEAKALMWRAHRLWDYLEQNTDVRQDRLREVLGGDQDVWRSICDAWHKMGLITRKADGGSYGLELSTRLGEVVDGKCSACGKSVEAPKAMFLETLTCPYCGKRNLFVILASTHMSSP